jgi:putative transposase
MNTKKEHYHNKLPHFQQPGQWYSVTCILHGAVPKGAISKYSMKLEAAKNRYLLISENGKKAIREQQITKMVNFKNSISEVDQQEKIILAQKEYFIALKKYRLAYDKILNTTKLLSINLTREKNRHIIEEALHFWQGKRIENHAWCIMSNHFHWILTVKKKDDENIYLEDILHSVKRFTANSINKIENHSGQFWEHESFDTTLRSPEHFYNAMNYTLQNPVSAGLVKNWRNWSGTWISEKWKAEFENL